MNTPPVRLVIDGDIFAPEPGTVTIIGHGVNLHGVMGGFAGLILSKFPETAAAYQKACMSGSLDLGDALILHSGVRDLWIANIVSQVQPGPDARLDALEKGLRSLYNQLWRVIGSGLGQFHVRLPLIGAGIGGLDPLEAADAIFASALYGHCSPHNFTIIPTTLYLLSSDPFTENVKALYDETWG